MIDHVTYGAGHFYISQTNKGGLILGGDIDMYILCAPRPADRRPCTNRRPGDGAAVVASAHAALWGSIMDMTMDGARSSTKRLWTMSTSTRWCYGGFKATPGSGWCFAHTIAEDVPHVFNAELSLSRFKTGHLLDEGGKADPQPALGRADDPLCCPYCGPRSHDEFRWCRRRHKDRPPLDAGAEATLTMSICAITRAASISSIGSISMAAGRS